MALPACNHDRNGQNAWREIVPARVLPEYYNTITARCGPDGGDAVLSVDGGATECMCVVAGDGPLEVEFPQLATAIWAKNDVHGAHYQKLVVHIGKAVHNP